MIEQRRSPRGDDEEAVRALQRHSGPDVLIACIEPSKPPCETSRLALTLSEVLVLDEVFTIAQQRLPNGETKVTISDPVFPHEVRAALDPLEDIPLSEGTVYRDGCLKAFESRREDIQPDGSFEGGKVAVYYDTGGHTRITTQRRQAIIFESPQKTSVNLGEVNDGEIVPICTVINELARGSVISAEHAAEILREQDALRRTA
jgi:hypothetical protein